MQKEAISRHRAHSPFDDSAIERLRRMGLLLEDGGPDQEAVAVLARVYAGQFFDDLCDFCQDVAAAQGSRLHTTGIPCAPCYQNAVSNPSPPLPS